MASGPAKQELDVISAAVVPRVPRPHHPENGLPACCRNSQATWCWDLLERSQGLWQVWRSPESTWLLRNRGQDLDIDLTILSLCCHEARRVQVQAGDPSLRNIRSRLCQPRRTRVHLASKQALQSHLPQGNFPICIPNATAARPFASRA